MDFKTSKGFYLYLNNGYIRKEHETRKWFPPKERCPKEDRKLWWKNRWTWLNTIHEFPDLAMEPQYLCWACCSACISKLLSSFSFNLPVNFLQWVFKVVIVLLAPASTAIPHKCHLPHKSRVCLHSIMLTLKFMHWTSSHISPPWNTANPKTYTMISSKLPVRLLNQMYVHAYILQPQRPQLTVTATLKVSGLSKFSPQ